MCFVQFVSFILYTLCTVYVCTFDARQHVVFINKLFEFEYIELQQQSLRDISDSFVNQTGNTKQNKSVNYVTFLTHSSTKLETPNRINLSIMLHLIVNFWSLILLVFLSKHLTIIEIMGRSIYNNELHKVYTSVW